MPFSQPPPHLWSISVIEEAHPGRPVLICVDERLRAGLLIRTLRAGNTPCAAVSVGLNYRCRLNGRDFGVSTLLNGDPLRDVVIRSSVTDIEAQKTIFSRATRLRLVGACPKGWAIGDTTDQQSRRRVAAVITGTDTPAYPR